MEISKLKSIIEAIIFASGEPLSLERISEILKIEKTDTQKLCDMLAKEYEDRQSGIKLIRLENSYQFCTKPEYFDFVKATLDIRRNAPLSPAAFEVLAVIAYNQPVTKSFIEQVRGVDCSGVLNSLSEKGLIEEKGRLDLPGRPLIYGTTTDFLRCFSIKSLSELPPLPDKEQAEEDDSQQMIETA
ncbi:MAG: SMC-Scp complex subunit ScpB [Clostridiales bacterium 43-6]|nr:MAG: SMC-Scp complex subunit ScpB [Clostridiales bacterium 43-6]